VVTLAVAFRRRLALSLTHPPAALSQQSDAVEPQPQELVDLQDQRRRRTMLKGGLLWMLGIPIPIIILLFLFGVL
jgi:hypothetical protein